LASTRAPVRLFARALQARVDSEARRCLTNRRTHFSGTFAPHLRSISWRTWAADNGRLLMEKSWHGPTKTSSWSAFSFVLPCRDSVAFLVQWSAIRSAETDTSVSATTRPKAASRVPPCSSIRSGPGRASADQGSVSMKHVGWILSHGDRHRFRPIRERSDPTL